MRADPLKIAVTFLLSILLVAQSPGADLKAKVQLEGSSGAKAASISSRVTAVLWLNPLGASSQNAPMPVPPSSHYRLIQEHKEFRPHILVVPVGSDVEFPNKDPFYHNVFSLFNGKRFDLGLYESGGSRTVRFDHEGVSYIFCNIHPQMGAVIIALKTPYFAIASPDGNVVFHNVPPGSYGLRVWVEGAKSDELNKLGRPINVSSPQVDVGLIRVFAERHVHKNKFGEDYPPEDSPLY